MTRRPMGVGLRDFGRQGPFEGYKFRVDTMALLVKLMLGSLRKRWPFRNALEEGCHECTWPQEFNSEAWLSLRLTEVGSVLVLALERLGRRR